MKRIAFIAFLVAASTSSAANAAGAQVATFADELASLSQRSATFAEEAGPVLDQIVFNTTGAVPGGLAAIVVPENGIFTVYVDAAKLATLSSDEVDVLLVHEVYGHIVPEATTGRVCDDPVRGQRYATSCVARREAKVLRELGMRPRVSYNLR